VGIDRPDGGDTPDGEPGHGADREPLLDPAARIAEHAGYPATVEQVYAAAREAWADAVAGLRSAWERHEEKYPERERATPSTQADGSWVAGPDRGLNPEQVDEGFSRNLRREFSPLLYSAERGDTMFDFVPISEEEASQIAERIRALADPDE
jgi:hypothetical protein